jgi:hypothetical protein
MYVTPPNVYAKIANQLIILVTTAANSRTAAEMWLLWSNAISPWISPTSKITKTASVECLNHGNAPVAQQRTGIQRHQNTATHQYTHIS